MAEGEKKRTNTKGSTRSSNKKETIKNSRSKELNKKSSNKKNIEKKIEHKVSTNTKNNNNNNNNNKASTLQLIIFVMLLIVVFVLGILIFQKSKNENNNESANISIPIIEKDSRFAFNVNALNLSQTDEYVFKVVNYRDDNINTEDFTYNITIINPTNAVIKMTKDDGKKNYLSGKKEETIVNEKLGNSLKEEHYYHIKVIKTGKLMEKDLISVIIQN